MRNIHEQAADFGIERPELEHQQRMEGDVTVISLTPDSELMWSNYLRSVTMAKLALHNQVEVVTM